MEKGKKSKTIKEAQMDLRQIQHEKNLVSIIFDRDTMIEQLGAQITQVMKENEDLKKEKEDVKKDGKKT